MKRRRRTRRISNMPWRSLALTVVAVTGTLGILTAAWWGVPRAWSAARAHPYFAVTEVTLRGNSRLGREQLLYWAGVHPGISIWEADPAVVRAHLRAHPDLADAQIRRDFPHRLVIAVRERTPTAIAVLDDFYFVDRGGHLMDRLRDRDSRDLPLITGLRATDMEHGGTVLLRRAARLIRLCQREGCGAGLSEVNVDGRRGVTIIPLRRPIAILLGWGGWRTKLARTTRVLAAWEGHESRVAVLDASYANQVIVRLRPVPARAKTPAGRHGNKPGVRT